MTKNGFVRRVQALLEKRGIEMRKEIIDVVLESTFTAIKDVVAEGDKLHVSGLGKFYAKEMSPRTVKGGWKASAKTYVVPARKKLGFSSFASTDKYVQKGRINRNMDGLFADVFED